MDVGDWIVIGAIAAPLWTGYVVNNIRAISARRARKNEYNSPYVCEACGHHWGYHHKNGCKNIEERYGDSEWYCDCLQYVGLEPEGKELPTLPQELWHSQMIIDMEKRRLEAKHGKKFKDDKPPAVEAPPQDTIKYDGNGPDVVEKR